MKTHFNYLIPKTAGTIFLLVLLLVFAGHSYGATEKIPEAEQLVAAELPSPLLAHARSLAAAQPETNYVRILDIGEEALLARVHLIRSARKSIAIQTIIWVNDEVGRLMMYELIGAAKRGKSAAAH